MASGDVAFEATGIRVTEQDSNESTGVVTSTFGNSSTVTVPTPTGSGVQATLTAGQLTIRVHLNGSSFDPLFDQDKAYTITVKET